MYGNIGHKIINLPNVTYHGRAKIDDNFGKMACEKYDFFVNTSVSDANPTTCTEAAAFGIPVICTVGTGYWPNEPFINIDDNNAVKTIEEYQHIDGTLLLKQARKQRRWAENDCNWDLFCNKITNKLFELHKNKAVP
jgi:glycosyltransferase involved in cell wall biosynthesis